MLFTLLWVPKTSNWISTLLENYCTDASHAAKSNRIEIITPWLFTWRSSEYKNLHVQSGGCNFAGQTINMWKKSTSHPKCSLVDWGLWSWKICHSISKIKILNWLFCKRNALKARDRPMPHWLGLVFRVRQRCEVSMTKVRLDWKMPKTTTPALSRLWSPMADGMQLLSYFYRSFFHHGSFNHWQFFSRSLLWWFSPVILYF